MRLRQRLKISDDPINTLWDLDPKTCSDSDVKTLLRIREGRKFDPLNFLALEADQWLRDNIKILRKRFT